MDKSLSDPDADPLAKERGTRRWSTRRWALLAAGLVGAAAFAFGAAQIGVEFGRKGVPEEARAGAAHNAEALTP
jgi:hypothetical protein